MSMGERLRAATGGSSPTPLLLLFALNLVDEFDRLYVPKNDARWLRRNALVALGNVGKNEPRTRAALERYADGDDEVLAEHARWALARLEERCV